MTDEEKFEAIKKIIGQNDGPVVAAARKVVAARYAGGDDGWDRLKNAIGELEDLVGRP